MSDLSSRILVALDEAVAQEVGARLRQAAQNVPSGTSAPALPNQFEQSLQRLRALHAQVKAIVGKTFGDAVDRKISNTAGLGLTARGDVPALKMLEASAPERTPRRRIRKKKRGRRPSNRRSS
jgi:hypothetical protein